MYLNFILKNGSFLVERVGIIKLYFQSNSCASRFTARLFNNTHLNVNHSYVTKLMQMFTETVYVCYMIRQPQSDIRNKSVEVAVLRHVALDRTQSARQ